MAIIPALAAHEIIPETKMVDWSLSASLPQSTASSKRVKNLVDFLASIYNGQNVEPWTVFEIRPEEIETVWSLLRRNESLYSFVLDKIRLVNTSGRVLQRYNTNRLFMSNRSNWSPYTSRFIVRMPTDIHELFTAQIVREIQRQLDKIALENEHIAATLDRIFPRGSPDIYFVEPSNSNRDSKKRPPWMSPDASFGHIEDRFPAIVIETSYSQHKRHLEKLAYEYISGSKGKISTVVGLDIGYGTKSEEASLSIWRPRVVPDLKEDGSSFLEIFSPQETEVMTSLSAFY